MKIPGAVVIVAEGCSGFGSAIVEKFAAAGATVLIADNNAESGATLAESHENVHFHQTDCVSEESVQAAVAHCVQTFRRVDVIINAMDHQHNQRTITSDGQVHDLETYMDLFDRNVTSMFNFCRFGVAALKENVANEDGERGAIVNISSIAGTEGRSEEIAYAPSKGAVNGMTLPLARDLARFGIRVNTIAPGPFEQTESEAMDETVKTKVIANIPLGRFGRPTELAHCAQFLVENTYITGSIIRLDGGLRVPYV
jgi:NAD(P)-dependent dehydrogenase (short-subunit alcohol dehydrogenase family)